MTLTVPCPVLVGRAAEAAALTTALDAARRGRGSVVFVAGEAGIGKSRLVHDLAALAGDRGARVLRGRAVPGSGAAAFRPLTEALAPVLADGELPSELGSWRDGLAAILPVVRSAGGGEVTAPVRGESVVRLLRSTCGAGGLVILEDLHWADPETLAVVEHLSDNMGRAPVLLVATIRSDEPSAARDLARRLAARRVVDVLHLTRLNEAQVAAMVHGCTGGSDAAMVERIRALADGVPFLVEEMLASPGLPASFTDAVRDRLEGIGDVDRNVLVSAAAFGRHFDWRLVGAAAGVSDDDVIAALERGLSLQLVEVDGDGFRFRHALTAEAVFESVVPPRRRALAAAALRALDGAHPDLPPGLVETAARLAELAGEHERAGALHHELGDDALERGALHTAVVALERAAALRAPGDDRALALERLVEALVLTGKVDEASAVGAELVVHLPRDRAAAVHLRLAAGAATAARWSVATEHLTNAAELVEASAASRLGADLALGRAEVALGTNDAAGAAMRAREALAVATEIGAHDVACGALQLLGRCARMSSLADAEAWFRRALDTAERHGLATWRLRALHELGTIALLETSAVEMLVEAQELAESIGAMATATVLDIEIAAGHNGRHDLEGQDRHGRRAVQRGTELGMDLIVAYGWQHVAVAARLTGDVEGAANAANAARAAAPGNRDTEGLLIGVDVLGALMTDDLDGAVDAGRRMTDALRGSTTAPPAHHRAAWPLVLAVTGRAGAATAAAELDDAGISVNRGARQWLTMTTAVLAGRTDPARAARLARDADTELAGMPLWRNLGRRLVAQAAATDGWAVPPEWMAEAEAWFRAQTYTRLAAACRRLRHDAPTDVPVEWAARGITRRESDVLRLVVDGCSNKDIADRLYLSVRTVEKHVEALLRKTSTSSRTELAHVAAST